MGPGRKRRRSSSENSEEEEEKEEETTTTTVLLQPYSKCSASAQSRRRAQLHRTIARLSGTQATKTTATTDTDTDTDVDTTTATAERVQLVSDTLSKADMPAYDSLIDASPLRDIMANIRTMHYAAPPTLRTAVLALVAGKVSATELKQKWGFSFGTHQFQAAKQMGSDGSFATHMFESPMLLPPSPHNNRKRAMMMLPPSRRPKPDEFVDRLVEFVSKHTTAKDGSENVLARPLRALHRDFVSMGAENKVCFSTFRALVLERFRLPGTTTNVSDHAELEQEKAEKDSGAQNQQQPQSLENTYVNTAAATAVTTDIAQQFSLNQGLEGLISSLDLSSLGVDPVYYQHQHQHQQQQQPANLSLPSLQSLTAGVDQQPQAPLNSRSSEIPTIQNLFDLAAFNSNNQQQQQQQQREQQQDLARDADDERFSTSEFFYF
ncbi:hypothetical protein IWW48_003865 [Coemansia sp. RSA 1200]|nr:hypothetical protein IWW48_003865 [Coemansia sp. RSA 1200]